ncbi:hypothetical protein DCAR_0102042 [Daucus carota subsp. sativus]|uniref:J domain-containing protein n=1 Tax=Daucus carota subsp. sativus TaxID=79200 RepID=A0AAF1AHJ8_DAUCS|nr:hypothetical protein DCAR_0102042 [Daucus carota subsp. sativus]
MEGLILLKPVIYIYIYIYIYILCYKKLALKWHPDKHKGDSAVTNKFQAISEAYTWMILTCNGLGLGHSSIWDIAPISSASLLFCGLLQLHLRFIVLLLDTKQM